MNIFKKIYKSYKKSSTERQINEQEVNLSLDDSFVHNFISKGGRFLYCTSINEVASNLKEILKENNWNKITCSDFDLLKITDKLDINIQKKTSENTPYFTSCEHLIANKGDILFSSNQIGSDKLSSLSKHFVVYATTSQLVKNMGEGLTGIKTNFQGNIPTNISSITNYKIDVDDDSFLTYGNSNSKNLYLLLFEDL
ncbi:LUD domain-containing protein [Tenacibaculum ovolyticum]|uniref:LUD domain-containing protein n=1 Tax=Tenacibaculum ovolyticum TaxID=104270 RepID=UPI00042A37F3|nr:LUD domain-containing protein [Tenacibaculum ovolyticum]WBX75697.1 LUD domain-containing protein [Tenacibaculum ovolyticum]